MSTFRFVICITLAELLTLASLEGQGLTSQISGVVQDPSRGAIAGAVVTLKNTGVASVRTATTDPSGAFVFPDLLAGTYNLSVTAPGFKAYDENNIVLGSSERSALRAIVLQLGQVSESVSVTAESALLQTQSGERASELTTEVTETPQKGRLFFNVLALVPGIIDTGAYEGPGDTSGGIGGIQINGSRAGSLSLTNDGVPDLDVGCQCGGPAIPPLESIGEVKVMLSNYQAEYGRNSGGMITTVTKAGTPEFHGGAYYFVRNEDFNANDFFSNRAGLPRTHYRYNELGYYLGGPVLIPHLLKTRNKLFFFWSQDYLPRTIALGPSYYTFPTALERTGNFSQTVDTSGKLIPVEDPTNGKAPFPGNIIPPSRLSQAGIGLLSLFPLPNSFSPTHTYNSVIQGTQSEPHGFQVLRVDWNIHKTTYYARLMYNHDTRSSNNWFNSFPVSNTFPLIQGSYNYPSDGAVITAIHTYSPTLINEFTAGVTRYVQDPFVPTQASLAKVDRATLGINFPQFYPQLNPLNVVPNSTFTDVQDAPSVAWEGRWIFFGTLTAKSVSDNITKVYGKHNFKFGAYFEGNARNASATGGPLMGTANFSRDTNDPNDTNYGFANAALGTLTTYTEGNTRLVEHARDYHIEWFAQDSWRATKRLTFDVGVRFYHLSTPEQAGGTLASFQPSAYNAASAAKLIQPVLQNGVRMGMNPATGQVVPADLIGALAPGSGTVFEGMQTYYQRILTGPALSAAPRFGFAWDVFGDGKTAVRGGFGIYPGIIGTDTATANFLAEPPLLETITLYDTSISGLLNTPITYTPATVRAAQHKDESPTSYNLSFGVQRDLGFHTVLDVSYVSTLGRHLTQTESLNAVPYGTNSLPTSIDHTTGSPLPINFLRPTQGYGDITYFEFSTTSHYNSLQTSLKRSLQKNLLFSAAWTWSSNLDYTPASGTVDPFTNYKEWNYGKDATDRTHVVVLNFDYTIPSLSGIWKSRFASIIGDGWGISGIPTFMSGVPLGISYSLVSTTDLTGGGGAGVETRVNVLGNVNLPMSQRTDTMAFNTAMIAMPPSNGLGNASREVFRGLGVENFDTMLSKMFRLGADHSKTIVLRVETYNTLNHTRFSAIDTTARFSATGAQTNADFGAYTADINPRKIQLGLKFAF